MCAHVGPSVKLVDSLHQLIADRHQDPTHSLSLGRYLDDPVQHDSVRRFLDQIEHVVQRRCQAIDIVAIERRDEGGIQLTEDAVSDIVAEVLEVLQTPGMLLEPVATLEHGVELAHGRHEVVDILPEEDKKLPLFGNEAKLNADPSSAVPIDRPRRRHSLSPPQSAVRARDSAKCKLSSSFL